MVDVLELLMDLPYSYCRTTQDQKVVYVRGSSNIVLRDETRVALQLRDSKPGIFYPGHLDCFGGGHKRDIYDPKTEVWRELTKELDGVEDVFDIGAVSLKLVTLLPFPQTCENPQNPSLKHGANKFIQTGYTHFVVWYYGVDVPSLAALEENQIECNEGKLEIFDVPSSFSSLDPPLISRSDLVLDKIVHGTSISEEFVLTAPTYPEFEQLMNSHGFTLPSHFENYRNPH